MALKEQISLDVTPEQKRRLHEIHIRTKITKAELVRIALSLLFRAQDTGELPKLIAGDMPAFVEAPATAPVTAEQVAQLDAARDEAYADHNGGVKAGRVARKRKRR